MQSRRSVQERAGGLRNACLSWLLVKVPDSALPTVFPVLWEVNRISRELPGQPEGSAGESKKVVKKVHRKGRFHSVSSVPRVAWVWQHQTPEALLAVRRL